MTEYGHPHAPDNDPPTPSPGEGPTQHPAADVPPQPAMPHHTAWLPPQPHQQIPHQGPVFGVPGYPSSLPPAA